MTAPIVLLVEDSPDLALIVSALGRRGGYAVECRTDVAGAWEYLAGAMPDLVLLDLRLPGESGLELCRRVRAEKRLAQLPVALFGHGGLTADLAAALEAGVDFFVAKELTSQPVAWQRRLAEILPPAHGQPRPPLLGWTAEPAAAPTGDWVPRLRGALRHPAFRGFGPEVQRILLRRAAECAFPEGAPELDALLTPAGLPPAHLTPLHRPDALHRLVASLVEQVWCLLGTEAGAPVRAALTAVVSGSSAPPSAHPEGAS